MGRGKNVRLPNEFNDDSLAEYMNHDLFTQEEEVAAFERLKRAADTYGKSSNEWIAIQNEIVQHNYRLVIRESMKFRNLLPATMQYKECFSAGCVGLIWAVGKYDLSFGTRFSTYAVPWIGRAIRSEISKYDSLHRSSRILGDVRKIAACQQSYEIAHGEAPAMDTLAELTGMSKRTLNDRINSMSVVLSLDAKVGDVEQPDAPELRDIIPCTDNIEQRVEEQMEYSAALNAMAIILNDMCQDIIRRHCGIGCPSESYEAIAQTYGCPKSHIVKCERKALTALQHYLRTGLLPIPQKRGSKYGKK